MGAHEEIEFIPIDHIRNIYPGFESSSPPDDFIPIQKRSLTSSPKRRKGWKPISLGQTNWGGNKSYSEIMIIQKIFFPFYSEIWFVSSIQSPDDSRQSFQGREIKTGSPYSSCTEPPSRLSFLFVAILINKALIDGVFLSKGWDGKIPRSHGKRFSASGRKAPSQRRSEEILIRDRRVDGIRTKDGKTFQSSLVRLRCQPESIS